MNKKNLDQAKYGKHNRAFYKLSKRRPQTIFYNPSKGIDCTEYLSECFEYLNPGVVGPDGITNDIYKKNMTENINNLAQKIQDEYVSSLETFKYPKEIRGKQQIFEIAPMDDRILHMAISMRLNAIYDPIFGDLNYAFRKSYGVHRMISDIYKLSEVTANGSIAKADIQGYFSSITRVQAKECLERKVSSEKFIKLTLDLAFLDRDKGLILGSSLSPTISNIVGHYLLDEVYEKLWAKYLEKCEGLKESNVICRMLRYADDLFFVSNHPEWARQMQVEFELEIEKLGFKYNEHKTDVQPFGYQIENKCDSHMGILGFSLGQYSYIDSDDDEMLRTCMYYPIEKQKEHGTQILTTFKDSFDIFSSTIFGPELIESTYFTLRETRKEIKQMIQYYMCSNTIVLEGFLKELANAIKTHMQSKGLRPNVTDKIIQNSGIQDLISYQ